MKKITLIIILAILGLTSNLASAQGYSFTLINNGDYSFTIAAVPDFDSGTFKPITQSYGFALLIPDGITVNGDVFLPAGTAGTLTFVNGADVVAFDANMTDKDLYMITADTAARLFEAHSPGTIIPLVTVTVSGSPTTGEISILDNDSTLANAPELMGALDGFIQVDVIDDGTYAFTNQFVGLTGTTSFDFSTLGLIENELIGASISVYPNPASDVIIIKTDIELTKVELYDILGKRVLESGATNQLDISSFKSGVYLMKLHSIKGTLTKKLVIE